MAERETALLVGLLIARHGRGGAIRIDRLRELVVSGGFTVVADNISLFIERWPDIFEFAAGGVIRLVGGTQRLLQELQRLVQVREAHLRSI